MSAENVVSTEHLLGKDRDELRAAWAECETERLRLQERVTELEPGAECWAALSDCGRIKLMGCAGLHPDSEDFASPYGHIGLEFWTQHKAAGDAQDLQGRDWFCRFMTKALAVYRAAGKRP